MIRHVICAWSVTWLVHGQPQISAWSGTWSVHDLSCDQCMISHVMRAEWLHFSICKTAQRYCCIYPLRGNQDSAPRLHFCFLTSPPLSPYSLPFLISNFWNLPFGTQGKSWKLKVKSFSCVQLSGTPWTVAYQALPSMGFSRQEYWSGLPFPSPGDLPNPGIEPRSSVLQTDALLSEPPEA